MNPLARFFSPERRAARLDKALQRAVSAGDQPSIAATFVKLFRLLLKQHRSHPLSELILVYGPKVEHAPSLHEHLSAREVMQAVRHLELNRRYSAALVLCDWKGYETAALEILAKQGRADEIGTRLEQQDTLSRDLVQTAVALWEQYNGDIRSNQAMRTALIRTAQVTPECVPGQPRVREIIGQYAEAARLYSKGKDWANAARCYQQAGDDRRACNLYERIGEYEKASQAAERMGDLTRALRLVVNPERRASLLINLERFAEARTYAAGLESPEPYFAQIRAKARQRMEANIQGRDFIRAMELAAYAECDLSERETILELGQQHFEHELASAASQDEIKAIYRDTVTLLEQAGRFTQAGRIAEEVLEDRDYASLLYEKAKWYNKAIDTATSLIRKADLHAQGGNQLEAARLYEAAGEYASAYEKYLEANRYDKAIQCYLQTPHPSHATLIRLYTDAGAYEQVIQLYLQSGEWDDLERALSIATDHNLRSQTQVIQERMDALMSGTEQDMQECFAAARRQVLDTYTRVAGIDFGTTNSVIALYNKSRKTVEAIPNAQGIPYEPSYFGLDEHNHPIFGEAARRRSLTMPDAVVARVKRTLGEGASFSIHGKQYKNQRIVADFLQHLVSNAERYLNAQIKARFADLLTRRGKRFPAQVMETFLDKQSAQRHIEGIVLSVPAYFNDDQKRATRDSARIAHLKVRRLLHEPTAAALAYSHQRPYTGRLAVIDLGGGTLDISIVDISEGLNEVQSVGGDVKLGGSDIDALLVQHSIDRIRRLWGVDISQETHPVEIARLRDASEHLKISLSSMNRYELELPHFLNRPEYRLPMTRTELERLSKPILDRFKSTIEKTIRDYGSTPDDYVLVGNATKMPAIRDLAQQALRSRELRGLDPGTIVAQGAALQAAILAGDLKQILVLDVVPYSLGIAALRSKEDTVEEISRLIERNSKIPCKSSNTFTTRSDDQPNVHIRVFQGESRHPYQNHCLGDFILGGIQPAPAGTPKIDVRFDIGIDCILTVTAVDQDTGSQRSIRIEGAAGLTEQEIKDLSNEFEGRIRSYDLESDLTALRGEIRALKQECDRAVRECERTIQTFFDRFRERVERGARNYDPTPDQVRRIQEMYVEKDQFAYGIPKYRDRLAATLRNLETTEQLHLDFSDPKIDDRLRERINVLSGYRRTLEEIIDELTQNVTTIVDGWVSVLNAMEPNWAHMGTIETAKHYLSIGQPALAVKALEHLAASGEGLTEAAFRLLLRCYVGLGQPEAYRNAHRRYGEKVGFTYPDLSRLSAHLKTIADSIFMVQGQLGQAVASGTGFCVSKDLIVTNKHVVDGLTAQQIRVVGPTKIFGVTEIARDPYNDLALLRVHEPLQPLRLGEFAFVEPGERVFAVGFPSPSSHVHSENIYISTGIVNSIRQTPFSPERVIFTDAKIAGGMSGGPLFNDLGEAIGIITLLAQLDGGRSPQGDIAAENQPVALPIHLVKKHL